MASRYELIHHPHGADDFAESEAFFSEIDPALAEIFRIDFRSALQSIANGRPAGHVYLAGHSIRWIKLKRFSHKVFFDTVGDDRRFILAVISSRRHPHRIHTMLTRRRKKP